ASRCRRSSPTSRAKGSAPLCAASRICQTRRDLPLPAGPRMSTALAPIRTADAWIEGALVIASLTALRAQSDVVRAAYRASWSLAVNDTDHSRVFLRNFNLCDASHVARGKRPLHSPDVII